MTDKQLERLAGDLHDGLLQYVIAARMTNEALRRKLQAAGQSLPPEIDSLERLLQQAIAEGRRLISCLEQQRCEAVELASALRGLGEELAQTTAISCDIQLPDDVTADQPTSEALWRIAQEAVSNIRRHSGARSAWLVLERHAGALRLTIADDGAGFEPQAVQGDHLGLVTMRRRAESLGGQFRVESAPGQGTRLTVHIPIRP
jgi:signal transduction histidine kinase